MLKDIGLQMIEKCDGLPLAVKVMGGLLCKKEKTRNELKRVLNDDIWSVSQMPEELNYAIYLSYDDLSPWLKQVFLHFSLKPKNIVQPINEVVSMWISEGLVPGDMCSPEEEGTKGYMELILRNLVETDTSYPGQFNCTMHDVIRSFAKFITRDEALVTHGGDSVKTKLRSHNFLRLSMETRGVELEAFEWRYLREQKSLRTLIISGSFQIQAGDSLTQFSSLRTLHIESADVDGIIDSVHQLKHLRYLAFKKCIGISRLPESIHMVKFLQHVSVEDCEGFVKLPDSIYKIGELRYLDIDGTNVNSIPRGFGALVNLKVLHGFPAYMDGNWCSLKELGPLSEVKELSLEGLDTVFDTSSIAKARLGEKTHLTRLRLHCNNGLEDDGWLKGGVSVEDEQRIQDVFDGLCPLPCLEFLAMKGYFGRQLPRWMMWTAEVPLENLKTLFMNDLACCTQLPDGLCRLPCLEFVGLFHAPTIKRVGPEFVQPHNHGHHALSSQTMATFPRLHKMILNRMVEWKEWEWEEKVQAMPALEELDITHCKLRCIPPGLAFHARSLRKLTIWSVKGLQSIENFASVVELDLYDIPYLTRVSNFPKLQKLEIDRCPKVDSLQEMSALRRLLLSGFYNEEQLPLYLQTVKPSHLQLDCKLALLASMAEGKPGSEWDKFSHIQRVEGYSNTEGIEKRWHVFYTREPYNMETNIDLQSLKMYCDGYEDRSEEEWMCHDPAIKRTKSELAWIQQHASIS